MKYFVCATSMTALLLAESSKCNYIRPFKNKKLARDCILKESEFKQFLDSDVIIVGGTWGNDLRKKKRIPLYEEHGLEYIFDRRKNNFYENELSVDDITALMDIINTEIVKIAIENSKPLIVLESATLSRSILNYDDSYRIKNYSRFGLHSWIYGEGKWLSVEDFEEPPILQNVSRLYDHSWRMNETGSIYILTGLETDPTSTEPIMDFLQKTISKIREKTNRKIVVKLHNQSIIDCKELVDIFNNIEICDKRSLLKDHYQSMYCAVIDNSTSIFQLIDAGIPTFCSSVNFGAGLGNVDIENIEDMFLASKEQIADWSYNMACTELKREIFASDEINTYIRKLVERHC